MKELLLNLVLALTWVALTGRFQWTNFAVGFLIGFCIIWLSPRGREATGYVTKLRTVIGFALFFIWELIKANCRVAYDVLTPGHRMRPGVIAIPIELESDQEIMLLTAMITLTPGTLTLDVAEDKRTLYIHAMYIHDRQEVERSIKDGYERRVREVFR